MTWATFETFSPPVDQDVDIDLRMRLGGDRHDRSRDREEPVFQERSSGPLRYGRGSEMASDIDLSEPATGGVSEVAMNPFEATVLQQSSLGAILQIPTKGWNESKLRLKSTGASPDVTPDRVLVLYKLG